MLPYYQMSIFCAQNLLYIWVLQSQSEKDKWGLKKPFFKKHPVVKPQKWPYIISNLTLSTQIQLATLETEQVNFCQGGQVGLFIGQIQKYGLFFRAMAYIFCDLFSKWPIFSEK